MSASNSQQNGSWISLSSTQRSLTTLRQHSGAWGHVSTQQRLENGLFFLSFHGVANWQATEQWNGSKALLSGRDEAQRRPVDSTELGGPCRHELEAGERTILPRLSHLTIGQETDDGTAAERHSQA